MSGRVCSAGSTVLWDGPPSCSVGARLTVTVEERSGTMTITVLGIDLGKNSCSVAGLDESGRVVLRRRLTREGLSLRSSVFGAPWLLIADDGVEDGKELSGRGHEGDELGLSGFDEAVAE